MAEDISGQQIQTDLEAIKGGDTAPSLKLKKIELAQAEEADWRKQARESIKIYEGDEESEISNLFHSNVETLIPTLYNSTPIPDVRRRYSDEDPVAKQVSDMSERAVSYLIDQYAFDKKMVGTIKAGCVAGRGVPRVRFAADIDASDNISEPRVWTEVVSWDRFIRGPAREWEQVPWVAFEHDLTADDLEALGVSDKRIKELANSSNDGYASDTVTGTDESDKAKAESGIYKTLKAFEIWERKNKTVYWVTPKDKDNWLAKPVKDPLRLPDFFPVPQPFAQITRVDSLVPVNPYSIYKVLMEEFNALTRKIKGLVGQLKVRGMIDKDLEVDAQMIKMLGDGEFVTANSNNAFTKGGPRALADGIAYWPIDVVIQVLQGAYQERENCKQLIYEVTGLSDILRGATNPRETMGAQQMKMNNVTLRVSSLSSEVARVARDLFRMHVSLVATHFPWETIKEMTGIRFDPPQEAMGDPQMAQQAMLQARQSEAQAEQLLRQQVMRGYRIDIETDSTVRGDMNRNMEQMTQFLGAAAQYVSAVGPLAQIAPAAIPAMTEIFVSFSRKFKLGKTVEDALEQLVKTGKEVAANPPPDPQAQAAEMKMQADQVKAQSDQAKAQTDQQKAQVDMQLKAADLELKKIDLAIKQAEAQAGGVEVQAKKAGADVDFSHDVRMKNLEFEHAHRMKSLDVEAAETKQKIASETARAGLEAKKAGNSLDYQARSAGVRLDLGAKKEGSDIAIKAQKAKAEASAP